MANVFVELLPSSGYQIEFADGQPPVDPFSTQQAAIDKAKALGHKPLVARVHHLNDKKKPDHWRAA